MIELRFLKSVTLVILDLKDLERIFALVKKENISEWDKIMILYAWRKIFLIVRYILSRIQKNVMPVLMDLTDKGKIKHMITVFVHKI